jgi:hypothetical protein
MGGEITVVMVVMMGGMLGGMLLGGSGAFVRRGKRHRHD